MTVGVVYLLTNPPVAARLVVSIYSLRKWYDGPVTVFTTRPESHAIGELLVADRRLRVQQRKAQEISDKLSRVATYLTKPFVVAQSPYKATIFLDADTLIVGPLTELVESARTAPVTATTFCNWRTDDPQTNRCLRAWRSLADQPECDAEVRTRVNFALSHPMPAINVGVLAIQRGNPLMADWQRLTMIGRTMPTPEEAALQLLLPSYPHELLGCHFNCFPMVASGTPDVRIWHFVIASHLRDQASRELWLPAYEECYALNAAGMQSWSRIEIGTPRRPVFTRRSEMADGSPALSQSRVQEPAGQGADHQSDEQAH
jgi:hypothetical protein